MPYLVLKQVDRVAQDEVAIDDIVAWTIITALSKAKIYPTNYWGERLNQAHDHLYPQFKETFEWDDRV